MGEGGGDGLLWIRTVGVLLLASGIGVLVGHLDGESPG